MTEKAAETKPSDVVAAPAADATKSDAGKADTGKVDTSKAETSKADGLKDNRQGRFHQGHDRAIRDRHPAQPSAATATPAVEPAKEATKAASNVPPADQPVADKLRDMLGAKSPAISTARPNGPRLRSFIPRANLRRCGPRAAR